MLVFQSARTRGADLSLRQGQPVCTAVVPDVVELEEDLQDGQGHDVLAAVPGLHQAVLQDGLHAAHSHLPHHLVKKKKNNNNNNLLKFSGPKTSNE